ncbi:LysR family transcriptional regulator [Pseudomonas monteilii]|uniref:LysR family transcriptional regulator n=1 Tax=Pseudomonas monteilii TaxID=76759 RepID=UPI003D0680DA
MQINIFLDFLALCDARSFTRAAELRHVSQAAFSRRIQALETWANATLIERGSSPVRLTAAGEKLRLSALDISGKIARTRDDLSGSPHAEHVRIGTSNLLAGLILPDLWETWSEGRTLSARLEIGDVYDLVTELAAGSIDLLMVFQCPLIPLNLNLRQYESKVIMKDTLAPTASQKLIEHGNLNWPGTEKHPVPLMMWPQRNYFGHLVERILQSAHTQVIGKRVLESGASEVLRAMTARGYCVSWLPEISIRRANLNCATIGSKEWTLPLEVTIFRDRDNTSNTLDRLWHNIKI